MLSLRVIRVRQERSNVEPREGVLASANIQPAVGVRSEPAPANVAFQQISLEPIGSPDQPLLLEPRTPAQLALQIWPEEATR